MLVPLPRLTPTVYVGGVEVEPTYYGRSPCCSRLDQIQFRVPSNVTGSNVPVAVQIGNVVSNFTSVAIASEGGSLLCSEFEKYASYADFSDRTSAPDAQLWSLFRIYVQSGTNRLCSSLSSSDFGCQFGSWYASDAGAAVTIDGPNGQKQIVPVLPPFPVKRGQLRRESQRVQGIYSDLFGAGSYNIIGTGGSGHGPI